MPLYKIDEAIILDENGKNIVVPIEQDHRFYFTWFEPVLASEQQKFELFDPREPTVKEFDGKYYYVPEDKGERLEQHHVDALLRQKILHAQIQDVPTLLNYQLSKYPDQRERLSELKSLFLSEVFFQQTHEASRLDLKNRCEEWVKTLIRRKDRRPVAKSSLGLRDLILRKEDFEHVLPLLLEKEYVSLDQFTGKYTWKKQGIDLTMFGEVLKQKRYFINDNISPSDRHKALTIFFNSVGQRGFSARMFRQSMIDTYIQSRTEQFSFVKSL